MQILARLSPEDLLRAAGTDTVLRNVGTDVTLWRRHLAGLDNERLRALAEASPALAQLVRSEQAARAITTVAGTGRPGFSRDAGSTRDGGLAIEAKFWGAGAVAVNAAGDLYFVELGGSRVRKVDHATGVITTVAGVGGRGPGKGDGGPAAKARLDFPEGVALDAVGNLYILEQVGNRVRKVDHRTGVITTVVGTRANGSRHNGPAADAELRYPSGLAVDAAGNLYIADSGNDQVRKVDHATGVITTVAGTGEAGFSGDNGLATKAKLSDPNSVAVDAAGNLYIGDRKNERVRKVDHATGVITTVAGTGQAGFNGDNRLATKAKLSHPKGVAVDPAGNLYIAEQGNKRIRKVDHATGVISTVAGTGQAGFSGDNGPATEAQLGCIEGLAADAAGNLYVTDSDNHRVRKFRPHS